jgi:hypothetical protein
MSITRHELNNAVQALAKTDRPAAVLVLAKFGAMNTVEISPEAWQAVYDECTEAVAKLERKR